MTTNQEDEQQRTVTAASEWVNRYGYPLEYRVENVLRAERLYPRRGAHILDAATGKALEVDVLGYLHHTADEILTSLEVIVECKTLTPDRAWIFFQPGMQDLGPSGALLRAVASNAPAELASQMLMVEEPTTEVVGPECIFHFGGVEFGAKDRKGDSDALYRELSKLANKANLSPRRDPRGQLERIEFHPRLSWPILVVDGVLLSGAYDAEQEEITLQRRKWLRVRWEGSIHSSVYTPMDIVVIEHLGEFLRGTFIPKWMEVLPQYSRACQHLRDCFTGGSISPWFRRAIERNIGASDSLWAWASSVFNISIQKAAQQTDEG